MTKDRGRVKQAMNEYRGKSDAEMRHVGFVAAEGIPLNAWIVVSVYLIWKRREEETGTAGRL